MLTEPGRFKAWVIVRLRSRGLFSDRRHGPPWQVAARVYRDRAINLAVAVAMLQQDMHVWEDSYAALEQRTARVIELARFWAAHDERLAAAIREYENQ